MQHKVRLLLILLINKKVAKTLSNTTAVDGKQGEPTTSRVSKIISKIGAKANVVVDTNKTASAHDLRRSFGEQWASKLMPAQLTEIMRHDSIETTMKYYVGKTQNLWQRLHNHARGICISVKWVGYRILSPN